MSFILFQAFTVLFTWQSMGQSHASWFSSTISEIVFWRRTKLLWVWDDMGVSDYWQNFHFGVECPFNSEESVETGLIPLGTSPVFQTVCPFSFLWAALSGICLVTSPKTQLPAPLLTHFAGHFEWNTLLVLHNQWHRNCNAYNRLNNALNKPKRTMLPF